MTGYTGHDAAKLRDYNENNHALSGHEMIDAVKGAVATNEVNAAMGIICYSDSWFLGNDSRRNI